MSGTRYFLDTNAIIAFLQGNDTLQMALEKADWIGASAISVIEFFSFQHLTANDTDLFKKFISRIHVAGLSPETELLFQVASIRLQHRLKLPDAIIVAQSRQSAALLITNDKQLKSFTGLSF